MEKVDIIIPTYDNVGQLSQCIDSLIASRAYCPNRVIVINNGERELAWSEGIDNIEFIKVPVNKGWTGGLIEGLAHSTSKYVLFLNDDTYIPRANISTIRDLVTLLDYDDSVGAVGPTSNCVMGMQNIWYAGRATDIMYVPFLIGFCMLVRRSALDAIGGIDPEFHLGDDIDLSIRLRGAGYKLAARRDCFVFHHGFQTGEKIYGRPDKKGGWNSQNMNEDTRAAIIKKHGFLKWWKTLVRPDLDEFYPNVDIEGDLIRGIVQEHMRAVPLKDYEVLDIGCGENITLAGSHTLDINPNIKATYCADISKTIPELPWKYKIVIARHVLEHCVDLTKTLLHIKSIMEEGGLLIIACPDHNLRNTLLLDPTHVHGMTVESLSAVLELTGFTICNTGSSGNNTSFVITAKRGARTL